MERFRQVMIVRRAKVRERTPFRYSGAEFVLATTTPSIPAIRWRVIMWLWCPPNERVKRDFKTEVTNALPMELAALADGELEEVAFTITWPADMTSADARRLLREEYKKRIFKKLGFVPEGIEDEGSGGGDDDGGGGKGGKGKGG